MRLIFLLFVFSVSLIGRECSDVEDAVEGIVEEAIEENIEEEPTTAGVELPPNMEPYDDAADADTEASAPAAGDSDSPSSDQENRRVRLRRPLLELVVVRIRNGTRIIRRRLWRKIVVRRVVNGSSSAAATSGNVKVVRVMKVG